MVISAFQQIHSEWCTVCIIIGLPELNRTIAKRTYMLIVLPSLAGDTVKDLTLRTISPAEEAFDTGDQFPLHMHGNWVMV